MTEGRHSSVISTLLEGHAAHEQAGVLRTFWESEQSRWLGIGRPGWTLARHLSDVMDEVIRTLCEEIGDSSTAVLAVGGYGQGRLAPHSDIDLLILTSARGKSAAPTFLYTLWDMGVVPSQSVHTVNSAIDAVKQETDTCTAFIDARLIWGDEKIATTFRKKLESYRKKSIPDYFRAKLAEQKARHEEADNSTYAIEPDVKQGRGGIRDLQTLHWLGLYLCGPGQENGFRLDNVLALREVRRIKKLEEFFWSVRVHLHRAAGRADDRLYFPLQLEIAEAMGFRSSDAASQVDRFMRYYFLAAREVSRLTETAIRRLEREALGVDKGARRKAVAHHPDIEIVNDQVTFAKGVRSPDASQCAELFHASGAHDLPVHHEAFTAISRVSRRLTYRELQARDIADRYTEILDDSSRLEPILRVMAETGFLGRLLPVFGAIVGRAEHGLFRRFTLDDHVLRSIGVLDRLCEGDEEFLDAVFIDQARELRKELAMALLLQEMPVALSHSSPQRIRQRIHQRVGHILDDKETAKLIAFAVEHRSLLVRTATRRELADPDMLRGVAEKIGTREQLAYLSLFTLCRQRVAGVGSWEEYSHRDVRLLVHLLDLQITGGAEAVTHYLAGRSAALRDQVSAKVGHGRMAAFDALVAEAGPSFWTAADVPVATRLAKLMAETGADEPGKSDLYTDEDGLLTVLVYGEDRVSLFAECAGLAAMRGGSVFGARGYAFVHEGCHRGVIMMQIQRAGTPPEPFNPDDIEQLGFARDYDAIASGHPPDIRLPPPSVRDRRHVFDVTPSIWIDPDTSSQALIVEVEARDRPGLLYLLVSHLSEVGVDTSYALVATYGHRAVDTFYLRDHPGYKIVDPRRIEVVRRQIMRALQEDAADAMR